jgi:hypothetical protein
MNKVWIVQSLISGDRSGERWVDGYETVAVFDTEEKANAFVAPLSKYGYRIEIFEVR